MTTQLARKLLLLAPACMLLGAATLAHAENRCGFDRGWRSDRTYGGSVFTYRGPESEAPIREGYRRGQLSSSEARHLEREREDLNREYRRDMADGYLSPGERADLRHDRHEYQRDLRHQLTDDEFRK